MSSHFGGQGGTSPYKLIQVFSLTSCGSPTWPPDCADWPGYPGQSHARDYHVLEPRMEKFMEKLCKNICLHKWTLIAVAMEAAMLEDSKTSHKNALDTKQSCKIITCLPGGGGGACAPPPPPPYANVYDFLCKQFHLEKMWPKNVRSFSLDTKMSHFEIHLLHSLVHHWIHLES